MSKWEKFLDSVNRPSIIDSQTGLEVFPLWIFWVLTAAPIWVILLGMTS